MFSQRGFVGKLTGVGTLCSVKEGSWANVQEWELSVFIGKRTGVGTSSSSSSSSSSCSPLPTTQYNNTSASSRLQSPSPPLDTGKTAHGSSSPCCPLRHRRPTSPVNNTGNGAWWPGSRRQPEQQRPSQAPRPQSYIQSLLEPPLPSRTVYQCSRCLPGPAGRIWNLHRQSPGQWLCLSKTIQTVR